MQIAADRTFFINISNGVEIQDMETSNSNQAPTASVGLDTQLSNDEKSLPDNIMKQSHCPVMSGSVTTTNLTNNEQSIHQVERIAGHTLYGTGCQNSQCHSAMMNKFNAPQTDPGRSKEQILSEATEFLYEFYRDCHPRGLDGLSERLNDVKQSIQAEGYYFHTPAELAYGVKLCWRNSSRCIMRSHWKNIAVVDARGPDPEYAKQITNAQIFD